METEILFKVQGELPYEDWVTLYTFDTLADAEDQMSWERTGAEYPRYRILKVTIIRESLP